MDKTIENKFFEAFKWGGVVDNCIDWMRYTYNLPSVKPTASIKEREKVPEQKEAKEKWDNFYRVTLPKQILEKTKAFDDSVIMYDDSPLMNEIEANLNDCQTEAQRERYLFSLLKPFGESPVGCGIARVYNPTAELNQLKEAINNYEKEKAYWQTLPEDEPLKNVNGEPSGTPKEQIEACNSMCKRYKEQMEWVLYVNRQFIDLTCTDKDKEGSVERCLSVFVGVKAMYANRLDALLLTYGIDLLRLQRESGLYLKNHRLITDVDCYIGSRELAQRYIDALSKKTQPEPTNEEATDTKSHTPEPQQKSKVLLPDSPNTGKATQRGRQSKTFVDYLQKEDKFQALRSVMNGKRGKEAALVIKVAIQMGWITKPTYKAVKDEFGDIGCESGYNKAMRENTFTDDEMQGMKNTLSAN